MRIALIASVDWWAFGQTHWFGQCTSVRSRQQTGVKVIIMHLVICSIKMFSSTMIVFDFVWLGVAERWMLNGRDAHCKWWDTNPRWQPTGGRPIHNVLRHAIFINWTLMHLINCIDVDFHSTAWQLELNNLNTKVRYGAMRSKTFCGISFLCFFFTLFFDRSFLWCFSSPSSVLRMHFIEFQIKMLSSPRHIAAKHNPLWLVCALLFIARSFGACTWVCFRC